MSDVVVLAVTAAFFALCLAYVRWCDHIIGPDPSDPRDLDPSGVVADATAGPDRAEVSA